MAAAKIAIIGSGMMGSTIAQTIALKELGEVVLYDVSDDIPRTRAIDIGQAGAIHGATASIRGAGDYADIKGADAVIITATTREREGMSRDELLVAYLRLIEQIGAGLKKYAPSAFVICASSPLDAMIWALQRVTGFPKNQLAGVAGILSSARFRQLLAEEFEVSAEDVQAMVLGGHGDAMVPLTRYITVAGVPMPDLIKMHWITQDRLREIVRQARDGGDNKQFYAGQFYLPAACAVEILEAYLKNKKRMLSCSALLAGEYGVKGMSVGVPAVIGARGVERVIELDLNTHERIDFKRSVEAVANLIEVCNRLAPGLQHMNALA
jgi:malate dehydrogenase